MAFIPPYILDFIASSNENSEELRISSRAPVAFTNYLRQSDAWEVNSLQPRGIVPDYILKNLAESQYVDDATRKNMKRGLSLSQSLRSARHRKRREVYDMNGSSDKDQLPGIYICSEDNPPHDDSDESARYCYKNLGLVHDYYREVHNRNSIDNGGMTLKGIIHYGRSFPNAFWVSQSRQIIFGDGDGTKFANFTKCLDVVGHLLAYGVIQSTANLQYDNQPGALNMSIADVLGCLVKQHTTKQKSIDADWLIGRNCFLIDIDGAALRSMKEPGTAYNDPRVGGKDPQPKSMDNYIRLPNTRDGDWGGVHINSGIPNHAFYLVAIGLAKAGLGDYAWDLAGPIWYEALMHEDMNPQCQFKDFALITCKIAGELAGENSTVAERVVKEAWEKVRVLRSAP